MTTLPGSQERSARRRLFPDPRWEPSQAYNATAAMGGANNTPKAAVQPSLARLPPPHLIDVRCKERQRRHARTVSAHVQRPEYGVHVKCRLGRSRASDRKLVDRTILCADSPQAHGENTERACTRAGMPSTATRGRPPLGHNRRDMPRAEAQNAVLCTNIERSAPTAAMPGPRTPGGKTPASKVSLWCCDAVGAWWRRGLVAVLRSRRFGCLAAVRSWSRRSVGIVSSWWPRGVVAVSSLCRRGLVVGSSWCPRGVLVVSWRCRRRDLVASLWWGREAIILL